VEFSGQQINVDAKSVPGGPPVVVVLLLLLLAQ
jgi:hypothetical protein